MSIQHQQQTDKDDQVKSERIWAHVICMYQLEEDLILIDRKKFNQLCSICKLKKSGACVQCPNCVIAFHPECARRAQMFMDQSNIYCYKHQPLKVKRILDNKHNNWVEEIQLFFRQIEKLEQQIAKRPKNHEQEFERFEMKAQQEEIEAEIKAENEQLLRKVEDFIRSNDKFVVTI